MPDSPFWHYHATFDAVELVRRYAATMQPSRPGYFTSYFGVLIDLKFFPSLPDTLSGQVETETVPANWHSDLAEFGGALRAVDLATRRFTMIELGCGYGAWMNLTGLAAKRRGLAVTLIGVEAEEHHHRFAREAMYDNGFRQAEYRLHRGIAGGRAGEALFPVASADADHWGLEPIFDSDPRFGQAAASGRFQVLPILPLEEVTGDAERIDLLHIDIQGGEAALVADALTFLNAHVAYCVIGTHSREIEGQLFATLKAAGWLLEIERPAIYRQSGSELVLSVDGAQGWRNTRLLPL